MGEVIRKDAAVSDILSDVRHTITHASAKGGDWQTTAVGKLGPIDTLATTIEARIRDAQAAAAPLRAHLDETNTVADRLIARVSDDCWNLAGRQAHDPALEIIFPGGISYYADGDVTEQPDKMDLLAELLEAGMHPRIPSDRGTAFATEIRAASSHLRVAVDAARPALARLALAERMQIAVARSGQVSLSQLKRVWKSDGKSETEIHSVIPDRPKAHKAPTPPAGGPPPASS